MFPLYEKCPYLEFSVSHFLAFGLNTARYGVSLRIQSEYGKIQTRKTLNTDTFHAVFNKEMSKVLKIYPIFQPLIYSLKHLRWNFLRE